MIEKVIATDATVCAGCEREPKAGRLYRYPSCPDPVCSRACIRKLRKKERAESKKKPEDSARVALIALTNTAATVADDLRVWSGELSALAADYALGYGSRAGANRVDQLAAAIRSSAALLARDTATAQEEING